MHTYCTNLFRLSLPDTKSKRWLLYIHRATIFYKTISNSYFFAEAFPPEAFLGAAGLAALRFALSNS